MRYAILVIALLSQVGVAQEIGTKHQMCSEVIEMLRDNADHHNLLGFTLYDALKTKIGAATLARAYRQPADPLEQSPTSSALFYTLGIYLEHYCTEHPFGTLQDATDTLAKQIAHQ